MSGPVPSPLGDTAAGAHGARIRPVEIIGLAFGLGGPNPGVADGPSALHHAGLAAALQNAGVPCQWCEEVHPSSTHAESALLQFSLRTASRIAASLSRRTRPLVIGGDHCIALGTWRGVMVANPHPEPVGLIWIDAHLDAHTPETSPSGRLHGMPLAALLGVGAPPLVNGNEPRLDPRHVCVVGVRSAEAAEQALLARLGVRVIDMAEIARTGLQAALAEARRIAGEGTAGYGISLDLDALDPHDAPAVGVPCDNGLRGNRLVAALRTLRGDPKLLALEIAEFDPHHDVDHRSARLVIDLACAVLAPSAQQLMALEREHGAHNYAPLPVVLSHGHGCEVFDVDGRRYLDMMAAYSAVSFGHSHPRLVHALATQAARLGVTSRAYHNDRLPQLLARLTELTGMDRALPMNTGMEAVETAIKAARKWAYKVKGVAPERAQIVVCDGNFHGRSTTIVGFSSETQYRDGFGPFTPGFVSIPFGDAAALAAAITPDTAAFLVEPIQGEGGIRVPPNGWLAQCARICREHKVLLLADEVQTGLGRTGKLLACWHEGVQPDGLMLGKALGGGVYPVSAFLARRDVMDVFQPGDHGSTFGGNPLGAAVALEALALLEDEQLCARAMAHGDYLMQRLGALVHPAIREVRGRGLFVGIEFDPAQVDVAALAVQLARHGLLTRDTHGTVLRFAPPLTISREQLDESVAILAEVLAGIPAR